MLLVDNGKRILLTHGHIYNKENKPKGKFDAIVYGHTHLWELTKSDDTVICNTGSITFPKNGNIPTFGVLENGVISIYSLEGEKLASETLNIGR
jgi:predicted phosphodiesterase